MNVELEAVERFAKDLQLKGKQPATVESYCRDARHFLRYLDESSLALSQVEPSVLQHYQQLMSAGGQGRDNSVRRSVIGVRQFFRFLSQEAKWQSSPLDDAPIPERVDNLPAEAKRNHLSCILEKIIQPADSSLISCRNATLMALLAYEGLKVSELIALGWQDFFASSPATLKITGDRQRTIVLHEQTRTLLTNYRELYLNINNPALVADPLAKIFIAFKGRDGSLLIPHMTRHGVKFILYELGNKFQIKHLNGELLRHHAISFLLAEGRAPEDVMLHLGLRRMGLIKKYVGRIPPSEHLGLLTEPHADKK